MAFKFKSNARFVKNDGTLTPEGLSALQPSGDSIVTLNAQSFVADRQVQVFLPSALAVTIKRGGQTITVTTNYLIMNPGDGMTLAAAQTIRLVPL